MRPFYNLRIRFAECEITQNEVARRAGMAPSTMTARMTGQQPFDAWQMDAIAQVLNIDRADYGKYFFDHANRKAAPDAATSRTAKAVKYPQITASIITESEENCNEV